MSQDDTKNPVEGQVYKTKDYAQFDLLAANRNTNGKHVQDLIKSFTEHPELVPTRPILVNENMEVIDGQHRLKAAMALMVPIYYTIAEGTDVNAAQVMNQTQSNWSYMDFARSYALSDRDSNDPEVKQKAQAYRDFLALKEEYPFSYTVIVHYSNDNSRRHGISKRFRDGQFRLGLPIEQVRERLDMLLETAEGVPYYIDSGFGYAMKKVMMNKVYDHDWFLSRLKQRPVIRQRTETDWVRAIEDTYNYNRGEDQRVRF